MIGLNMKTFCGKPTKPRTLVWGVLTLAVLFGGCWWLCRHHRPAHSEATSPRQGAGRIQEIATERTATTKSREARPLLKGRVELRPVRSKNLLGGFSVMVSNPPVSVPED